MISMRILTQNPLIVLFSRYLIQFLRSLKKLKKKNTKKMVFQKTLYLTEYNLLHSHHG